MRTMRLAALALVATTLAGCARRAAELALANAERAVAEVAGDAANVMPGAAAPLEEALAAGRHALERGDYAAAAAALQDLPSRADALSRQVAERREQLTADWTTLSAAMAANLDSVDARLARFGAGGPLPAGVDRRGLPAARAVRDSAARAWPAVRAEFEGGNLAGAMGQAMALRARVSEAMLAVGLAADDRAWGNLQLRPAPGR
jgi:hypothetical protein